MTTAIMPTWAGNIAPATMFIDGTWVPSGDGTCFDDVDPTTGDVLAAIADGGQAEITFAIDAASTAQKAWASLPAQRRAAVFYRAAELFAQREDDFVAALIAETGSGRGKAAFETSIVAPTFHESAALTTRPIGEVFPSQLPGRVNKTLRTAVGVVGVITPWNFPLYLTVRAFSHALALGNSIVIKPAEDSPFTGGLLLAQLFSDAGLPAGVLNVVTTSRAGAAQIGDAFAGDARVKVVSFTGSTAVGCALAERCAKTFTKTKLELGGKNPIVVLDDADIDSAVETVAIAAFLHQGQICLSADHAIVARAVFSEFVEKLTAKAKTILPTPPDSEDCINGPIINQVQLDRLSALIHAAQAEGATLHCGGRAVAPYYETTVITGVTKDMRIWREEIFGPAVIVTPYDTEAEAVGLANDTEYGLSASVLSGDIYRAELIAEQLRAGRVFINESTVNEEVHLTFSALGRSGGGEFGPTAAVESFTELRLISTQRPTLP